MNRRELIRAISAGALLGSAPMKILANTTEMKGNGMIIVTFEVEFEDDQIQEKRAAISAMDAATAKEDGCITYKSSFDANNPRILRIYEMWESMEALVPHFKTPHMAEFRTALSGLESKSREAKVYEVAQELPFPS